MEKNQNIITTSAKTDFASKTILKKHTFFSFWYFWTFPLPGPVLPESVDSACEILLRFSLASKAITTDNVKHNQKRSNCLMLILRSISSEIIIYIDLISFINPLSANPSKLSNALKLPTNCLSVLDYFVGLALKGLKMVTTSIIIKCKNYFFWNQKLSTSPYWWVKVFLDVYNGLYLTRRII